MTGRRTAEGQTPRPAVGPALRWFGAVLVLGVVVWRLELFGASSSTAPGGLLNGLIIAAAPWAAAYRAYRPPRSVALAPRGLATTPELGGTWLWAVWGVMLLAPAGEFAWGTRRIEAALAYWIVVTATWIAILEVQRRTRRPVDTEPADELSANLQLNPEAAVVGAIWAAAFTIAAVVAPGEIDAPWQYAAAALALGISVTYAAATIALARHAWIPAYAAGLFGLSVLGLAQFEPSTAVTAGLVAGAALTVAALEPKRRQLLRDADS